MAQAINSTGDHEIQNSRRERLKQLRSQCATDLEYEIESSQEHWTELADTGTQELDAANREVFQRLMECFRCRITGQCFFHDWGESLKIGEKIAEGGQAEIFEAELESDLGKKKYVVKVFKEGYSLSDLQRQWPLGMFTPASFDDSIASSVRPGPLVSVRRKYLEKVFKKGYFLNDPQRQWPLGIFSPANFVDSIASSVPVSTHFIHENCCFIHGGTLLRNGRFAFVLERYWGDLRRLIDVRMQAGYHKPFPAFGVATEIMLKIAQGVSKLHSFGILHRDLKASNILIRNSEGKLDELGSFSWRDIRNYVFDVADFESSSRVMGTGLWRAPEVLSALKDRTSNLDSSGLEDRTSLELDSKTWSEKSDVYAYAMTCYEVLTGRLPFEGMDGINNESVINGTRPLWFGVEDDDLRHLVMKCWHSNPSERPNFLVIKETLYRLAYWYRTPKEMRFCPSPTFEEMRNTNMERPQDMD